MTISCNSGDAGVGRLPDTSPPHQAVSTQPDVTTAKSAESSGRYMTEDERLKALYAGPIMRNTKMGHPPTLALAAAGEKAFQELGLSSPIYPSIQLNPPWNQTWWELTPGKKMHQATRASRTRAEAQKYARKADKWRYKKKSAFKLSKMKEVGREGRKIQLEMDEKFNKLNKLYRLAETKVEWYDGKVKAGMTAAYVQAIEALHYDE